jgi:hypothetical protein
VGMFFERAVAKGESEIRINRPPLKISSFF